MKNKKEKNKPHVIFYKKAGALVIVLLFLLSVSAPAMQIHYENLNNQIVKEFEENDAGLTMGDALTINSEAEIWTTDEYGVIKTDFSPGEIVYISGSGFQPNSKIISLNITRPDGVIEEAPDGVPIDRFPSSTLPITNVLGNFSMYEYDLDGISGNYTIKATDEINSAQTIFTDGAHVDFKQYANLDELWIGSILQSSNSMYSEGMSVPQRTAFTDIVPTPGNVHVFTFSHQATKAGNHAYDWLTAWNQGNAPPLIYIPWGENIGPHVTASEIGALHNSTGSYEVFVDVPDDPFISHHGSTQDRIDGYEYVCGNRQIRICGNQPIISASFTSMYHDVSDGGDTGNSYIYYELTWTSSSDKILIEMAGHLAMGGDPLINNVTWALGAGASNISGGPYHFKLDELDGHVLGSQDNQIKGADILIHPALNVTKTADTTYSKEGDYIEFNVTVENTGDVDLNLVNFTDTLMGDISSHFSPVLAPNAKEWYVYNYLVPIGAPDPLINTAEANYNASDTYYLYDNSTVSVDLVSPDIVVTKTADPTSGAPSTDVTFTLIVTNTGDCVLDPVEVIDSIPSGMSYVSDDSSGVKGPAGTITWGVGPLGIGASVTITLIAHIDSGASGTLHNVVDVTGTLLHGDDVSDSDSADVIVIESNIEVIKSVHYNCIGPWNDTGIIIDLAGEDAYDWVTFRINVTNNDIIDLNVTIKDVLPDGLINGNHYYPREPDYINGNELFWYYDGIHDELLTPGETITIGIRAEMGECNIQYMNRVYVTSQSGSSDPIVDIDTAYVEWINCGTYYPIDVNQSVYDRGFPIRHAIDGDWAGAQDFTPTLGMISSVDLWLRVFGSPEFDLTVELRTGSPDGVLLDSVVFTPGEVPSSWEWFHVDFADEVVDSGEDYFIVIPPAPSGVTTSFGYEWGYAIGNPYADGAFWFTRDGGGLWRDLPDSYEFAFRTYGLI